MANLSPSTAITDLQFLANRFRGLLDLIPKLEGIKSLEDYSSELVANVSKLEKSQDEAKAALLDAKKEVQAARDAVADILTNASDKAKQIEDDAKVQAAKIIEDARLSGAETIQELANQKAFKTAELANLNKTIAEVQAQVDTATSQYEALSALITEMKAKFS